MTTTIERQELKFLLSLRGQFSLFTNINVGIKEKNFLVLFDGSDYSNRNGDDVCAKCFKPLGCGILLGYQYGRDFHFDCFEDFPFKIGKPVRSYSPNKHHANFLKQLEGVTVI